jgi:hypothetical protein
LAQQVGDIVDVSFEKFMAVLSKTGKERLDAAVFNRTAKAFATFVRNCCFDNGRLKPGYLERVVDWCKFILSVEPKFPEEALIVLKSLLWTNLKFGPFVASFDYLFTVFIEYLNHQNPDFSKPASFALCRMAFAYPTEIIARYSVLGPKLRAIGPVHSLPILVRLAEKGLTDIPIWLEILELHIPNAFEIGHDKSIERALQCIGLAGPVFDSLPENIQRFCLSTSLSSEGPDAARAVGLLARSTAPEKSAMFLGDALRKLIGMSPPHLQALSNVLETYATRYRDTFEQGWIEGILRTLSNERNPYRPRCIGFLFGFLEKESEESVNALQSLLEALKDGEPKMRWNAAAALSAAFRFGAAPETAAIDLVSALDTDRIAKVKIKSAEALLELTSRAQLGDAFPRLLGIVIQLALVPAHFTNLAIVIHRKYNAIFRVHLIQLLFKLLRWTTARDFASIEEILIGNVDLIYELLLGEVDPPWESITRLYEAKFNSIPSKTLEKFQDKAFPV